jgi:mercuric ion binding protein
MMKNFRTILLTTVSIFLFANMLSAQDNNKAKSDTVKYWVSMDCDGCVAKINKNIAYEKGVKDLVVDLKTKTVVVAYKPKKTSPEKIEKAIKELGFKTELITPEDKSKSKEKGI